MTPAEHLELLRQLRDARADRDRAEASVKRLAMKCDQQREELQSLREDLDAARQQAQRIERERRDDAAALMGVML